MTKSEIHAKLRGLRWALNATKALPMHKDYVINLKKEIIRLQEKEKSASDDIMSSIVRSHKAICKAKKMHEKAAYGHDPAVYYSLAINGEAGELANKIIRNLREGSGQKKILEAVKSEIHDIVIYCYVLAYVLDIDLTKLVSEKVEIIIQRAEEGYYGAPLKRSKSTTNVPPKDRIIRKTVSV